jgi:methylmalonyl-CoA epimerase
MTSLTVHRTEIDELDDQIVDLLGRRFAIARGVAEVKREEGIPMMQSGRVDEVLTRVANLAEERSLPPDFVRGLYRQIIDETCHMEDEIIGGDGSAKRNGTSADTTALQRGAISLDHVAIAVRDLDEAIETYCRTFGFEHVESRTVEGSFSGMETAVLQAGNVKIVLVQGTSPESNVSQYIEHYGPGVQHIAIEVDDAERVFADLGERGCDLLTGVIKAPGLDQIFTRRDSNSGMQVEIIARAQNDGFAASNIQELFTAMEREGVY